ncbi:hypothetical protein WN55_06333 [Dufourea novaeangliae]|uniref:Uncharacterized protein n=1 Tax=Dufourea novaeangliae TaxID=178035 RepID=A0A154PQB6_DUFNO|nr:hypothetical protein WN55_06333 [Dufourea novaeangliae]
MIAQVSPRGGCCEWRPKEDRWNHMRSTPIPLLQFLYHPNTIHTKQHKLNSTQKLTWT